MARNGSGTYVLPAGQPVVTATTISSTTHNTLATDIATALTQSICTDGQTPMAANLAMGTHKITGLSNGTSSTDAVNYSQMISSSLLPQGRNMLLNGAMNLSERATTYALTTTATFGSLDRWAAFMGATAAGIWNQVAAPAQSTFRFVGKLGRTAASTSTGAPAIGQALETTQSLRAAGKTVIVSFYAYAGANFSAASNNITVILRTGTGTDQSTNNFLAGSWTGSADVISTVQPITTTLTRYQLTGTIGATATQIGVGFTYTPTGTAGADDNLYITGVQLETMETGQTTASTFERLSYTDDWNNCKRHFQKVHHAAGGYAVAGINLISTVVFPVTMRTTPTVTQAVNNLAFTQANVTASTSTYITDNASNVAYRSATGTAQTQFSEAVFLVADL